MIIVTGTKRSGTSMWMQLLRAAGFKYIGKPFPRNWKQTIYDANPKGFFESEFRKGINYKTNPHPKTKKYLFPEETADVAVKVFVPGLIQSDCSFIKKVVASMRSCRDYEQSLTRLYEMEYAAKGIDGKKRKRPVRMPPLLAWWEENFSLISDFLTRRYPIYMVAYNTILETPENILPEIFSWLGKGDVQAAIENVESRPNTKDNKNTYPEPDLEPEFITVFDELYDRVYNKVPFDLTFIQLLRETNQKLVPRIIEARKAVMEFRRERRASFKKKRSGTQ